MIIHEVNVFLSRIQPSKAWRWLINMDEKRYILWHKDHKKYSILLMREEIVGNRIHFEENIEGRFRVNLKWEIVECRDGEMIKIRALVPFPVYLTICLSSLESGTLVTHRLAIGHRSRILGMLENPIVRLILSIERQKILARHVKEEFLNLERQALGSMRTTESIENNC